MYVLGSNDGSLQEGCGFNSDFLCGVHMFSQTCLHVCMQALCLCLCVRALVSTARRGADERQRPPDQCLAVAAGGAAATAAERVGPREDESEEEGEKETKNMAVTLGAKKKWR